MPLLFPNNIPGATREHTLYKACAKLVPELIKYSSASAKSHDDPVHSEDGECDVTDEEVGVRMPDNSSIGAILHTGGGLGNLSMRF